MQPFSTYAFSLHIKKNAVPDWETNDVRVLLIVNITAHCAITRAAIIKTFKANESQFLPCTNMKNGRSALIDSATPTN